MSTIWRRLVVGSIVVAFVVLGGGVVLWRLGAGRWELGESVYMALISAATVGFGELPGQEELPASRVATAVTILAGIGAFTYLQSALTAFLVEGTIGEVFRRKRMQRQLEKLEGHVVVAGCGSTGLHVVEELLATRTPFVVIDKSHAHLERVNQELAGGRLLFVHGDATEDQALQAAGVAQASGVVAALSHDKDNLFVTLSARSLNPRARIVSKVVEPEAVAKMTRAGANATVSPNTIGGRRMVSELLRPTVVEFLDVMMRDKSRAYRFEEAAVPGGSRLVGKSLAALDLRAKTNGLVVGLRGSDKQLRFNPAPETVVGAGDTLVVLVEAEDLPKLRAYVAGNGA